MKYLDDITKTIQSNEQIPFWYSIVGYKYECGIDPPAVVAWIPLNYIIRLWEWVLRISRPKKWEQKISTGFYEAYALGKRTGCSEDNQKEINELMKKLLNSKPPTTTKN